MTCDLYKIIIIQAWIFEVLQMIIKNKDKTSQNVIGTCRCRCSSRNFSEFAISYSPFSKYRWSGLNLESVGGNFSYVFTNK